MNQETLVINLFGQPGAGKSTGAAYIFSMLKMAGVNAEYIQEFAKDKVWEENAMVFRAQDYIFGKQNYRMRRCLDKVEVIVTDSPLLLSAFYNNDEVLGDSFQTTVFTVFDSYTNVNYLLKRVKPYNPAGRYQTEEEATVVADALGDFLVKNKVSFVELPGEKSSYDTIVARALEALGKTVPVPEAPFSKDELPEDEQKNYFWMLGQFSAALADNLDCSKAKTCFCTGEHCEKCARNNNDWNTHGDYFEWKPEYSALRLPVAFDSNIYGLISPFTRRLLKMCTRRGITSVGIDDCSSISQYLPNTHSLYCDKVDAEGEYIIRGIARDLGIYAGAANSSQVQIRHEAARALTRGVYVLTSGAWHKE